MKLDNRVKDLNTEKRDKEGENSLWQYCERHPQVSTLPSQSSCTWKKPLCSAAPENKIPDKRWFVAPHHRTFVTKAGENPYNSEQLQ